MLNRRAIKIAVSLIILCMFIVVPTDKMVNGHPFDFAYKFIWNLGVPDDGAFPYTPNVPFLIAQIIGILAIAWLLSRDKN